MIEQEAGLCFPEDENKKEQGAGEVLTPQEGCEIITGQEFFENKVENSEVSQLKNNLSYNTGIVKGISMSAELTFSEQMERDLVATNHSSEKSEAQIQQKKNAVEEDFDSKNTEVVEEPNEKLNCEYFQKKADLEWENPMGMEANFKPKINNNMRMLSTTDVKNAQNIIKAHMTSINPTSFRNVKMPEVFENILVNSMVDVGQIALVGFVKSKNPKYYYDILYGRKRVKALSIKGEDSFVIFMYKQRQ